MLCILQYINILYSRLHCSFETPTLLKNIYYYHSKSFGLSQNNKNIY